MYIYTYMDLENEFTFSGVPIKTAKPQTAAKTTAGGPRLRTPTRPSGRVGPQDRPPAPSKSRCARPPSVQPTVDGAFGPAPEPIQTCIPTDNGSSRL